MHLADAFIQSDLQLHSGYTFFISMYNPWELNSKPFALLTQCSTTEPHRNTGVVVRVLLNTCIIVLCVPRLMSIVHEMIAWGKRLFLCLVVLVLRAL